MPEIELDIGAIFDRLLSLNLMALSQSVARNHVHGFPQVLEDLMV